MAGLKVGWMDLTPAAQIPYSLFDRLYWSEGALFQALGLANNDPVSTLPDEVGSPSKDLTGSSFQRPLYIASDAMFGAPVIRFDGSNDLLSASSGSFVYSQPNEVVVIARFRTSNVNGYIFDSGNNTASTREALAHLDDDEWFVYSGSAIVGGNDDQVKHLFRCVFNGASSGLWIDESSVLSGNAGTGSLDGLHVGSNAAADVLQCAPLDLVLLGVKDGTLTTQERSDLHAWAQDQYGVA